MRKITLAFMAVLLSLPMAWAGGLVTNTNQSATWTRMLARDASTEIDAVYYNPAGLTHLDDGFHLQVNSQTVMQTRTVTNDLAFLNSNTFEGETFVPALPTFFAAYKKDKFVVSGGFTVIGGGGSAKFGSGLPSFESMVAVLPSMASANGIPVTKYGADINFEGSSAYLGIQLGVSYKINDMISVGIGGRYILADNSYTGYIKNVMINPNYPAAGANYNGTNMVSAPTFFTDLATAATGAATSAQGAYTSMQPLIDGGAGVYTFDQAVGAGVIPQATADLLIGGIVALGGTADGSTPIATAYATYQALESEYTTSAQTATGYAAQTADVEVEATQSGTGITPIVSVDLSLMDGDLGIALKYEHKTEMTVKNAPVKDPLGMYPDGVEVPSDMPSFLSVGVRYTGIEKLQIQTGFHYYMDLDASYGKVDPNTGNFVTNGTEFSYNGATTSYLNGNSWEYALGLQYDLKENLGFSAGFLTTSVDPNNIYQSDISNALKTNSFALGAYYSFGKITLDLGFTNTMYETYENDFTAYKETYTKTAMIIAAGVSLKL